MSAPKQLFVCCLLFVCIVCILFIIIIIIEQLCECVGHTAVKVT